MIICSNQVIAYSEYNIIKTPAKLLIYLKINKNDILEMCKIVYLLYEADSFLWQTHRKVRGRGKWLLSLNRTFSIQILKVKNK